MASTSRTQAQGAWKTYNDATLNLPGEKALRSQYDAGVVEQTKDVLNFLNAPPPDPAAADAIAAQLTRANRALLLPLEQIRALYISRETALLRDVAGGMDRIVAGMLVMLALLGALWAPIIYVTMRGASTEERWLRSALRQRLETTRRAQLDSQIQRALDPHRRRGLHSGVQRDARVAGVGPARRVPRCRFQPSALSPSGRYRG